MGEKMGARGVSNDYILHLAKENMIFPKPKKKRKTKQKKKITVQQNVKPYLLVRAS